MSKLVLRGGKFVSIKEGITLTQETPPVVKDTLRRIVRSFAQAFVGSLTLTLPTVAVSTDLPAVGIALAAVGVSAALAGVTAAAATIQNLLEDAGTIRSTK